MKTTRDNLISIINTDIPDNSTAEISPLDIRKNLLNIIDSVSNLTEKDDLRSNNLETTLSRSTRIGVSTHERRNTGIFSTTDDVAVGYAALKSQVEAARNVAVGAYALTCNMYGEDNVAVGYHSLGNTIGGYANVGLGAFTLENVKDGNFNIAIGHGAGYYIGRDDTYKLYIASHPVDSDYVCANPTGSDLIPFIIGDMSEGNHKFGIGIKNFVDDISILQIAGRLVPSVDNSYDIGSSNHGFRSAYIHNSLYFGLNRLYYLDSSTSFVLTDSFKVEGDLTSTENIYSEGNAIINGSLTTGGDLAVNANSILNGTVDIAGHLRPLNDVQQVVGDDQKRWLSAHVYSLYVDGIARINKFEAMEQTHFKNKTIFLASTGDMTSIDGGGAISLYDYYSPSNDLPTEPVGHLLDEDLNGAGLKTSSRGIDYYRTYSFSFKSRDGSLKYLESDDVFSRSSWNSNISISVNDGKHIKTERVLSNDSLSLVTDNDGLGVFLRNGSCYFAKEDDLSIDKIGNANYNFIAPSGTVDRFDISISSPVSGVNLFQRFLNNTSEYEFDNTLEKLDGFQLGYVNDSELPQPSYFNEEENQNPNRFIISSYNQTAYAKRCFTLLQDGTEGYVGVTNFDNAESMLPDTMFNIRSTGNAIIRTTAENENYTAGLEILTKANCKDDGFGIYSIHNSGTINVRVYKDGIPNEPITIDTASGNVAIANPHMITNAMLSLGDKDHSNAVISLHHSSGIPSGFMGYGQLFTRDFPEPDVQTTLLSFIDSSGNLFNVNMTASTGGVSDRPVGIDDKGNTFVGIRTPNQRSNIVSTTLRNTMYGYEALTDIAANATDNVAIGYIVGKGVSSGAGNVFIGSNLIAGSADTNNIVIGTGITTAYSNTIVMGYGTPTVVSKADGIDKFFGVNNSLAVFANSDATSSISNIQQNSTHYNVANLNFAGSTFDINKKTYSDSNPYLTKVIGIDSTNPAPTASESYAISENQKVNINADLQVRGEIFFPNGTKIPNANFIQELDTAESNIATNAEDIANQSDRLDGVDARIDALVIEGVVTTAIQPGSNNRGGDWPSDRITDGSSSNDKLVFYIKRKVVNSSSQFVNAESSAEPPSEVAVVLRDPNIEVYTGDYVIAIKIGNEYRPISITGNN